MVSLAPRIKPYTSFSYTSLLTNYTSHNTQWINTGIFYQEELLSIRILLLFFNIGDFAYNMDSVSI